MMLHHLGYAEAAAIIETAIEKVLMEGKTLTPDLGGTATTWDVGEAIAGYVTKKG
jgi:tartrate dehydrogenase/decarboxylase/D-malate dehydrogenase